MLATTFAIDELTVPATLDDPRAVDFIDMVALRNTVEAEVVGSDALAVTPAELLPVYRTAFEPKRIFVARVDGRIVGRSLLDWSIAAGSESTWIFAEVLPEFRRRGIGAALFARVESLALQAGRPVLQSEALHKPRPDGERLASPTGFGDVPADDDGVRFLRSHGYRLEQVERVSFLTLPIDAAALRHTCATIAEAVDDEYGLVDWTGRTPADRVQDVLTLHTRMSTDAPAAGLVIDDEPWTTARLDELEDAMETSGRTRLTVAVEHRRTGRLVGFSELTVAGDRTRPASQEDTLVLDGHRGHRLGMLMKAANLLALNDITPLPPLIATFNAEENRHMLDVNEALGFRAVGHAGCWRKS